MDINNPAPLPGEPGVSSPSGDGNDPQEVVSFKDMLSSELGRDFKSDEDALKAVKDTFGYVGKVGKYLPHIEKLEGKHGGEKGLLKFMEEQLNPTQPSQPAQPAAPANDNFVSREQYETDTFFSKNQDLEPYRSVIEAVRKTTGKPLSEVVNLPEIKTVLDKAKAHDENEKSKSVLHTNPKLGQATDKISHAREAAQKGNQQEAAKIATQAVLDAMES